MWRPDINGGINMWRNHNLMKNASFYKYKWPSGLGNPQRRCRFGEPLSLGTPKHRKLWINTVDSGIRGVAS